MRFVLAAALSTILCASANAASVHRFKPPARAHQRLLLPGANVGAPPAGFAVPGWTDEQTREWLDYGSRGSHQG
jgi:hypothetical protein